MSCWAWPPLFLSPTHIDRPEHVLGVPLLLLLRLHLHGAVVVLRPLLRLCILPHHFPSVAGASALLAPLGADLAVPLLDLVLLHVQRSVHLNRINKWFIILTRSRGIDPEDLSYKLILLDMNQGNRPELRWDELLWTFGPKMAMIKLKGLQEAVRTLFNQRDYLDFCYFHYVNLPNPYRFTGGD